MTVDSVQETERQALHRAARRLIGHVEARTTWQDDDIHQVPAAAYADSARWHREVEEVFRRKPLAVALSAELPGPHHHKAIDVTGVPIVLRRGSDGIVRAFLNACRHRAAPVVSSGCGSAKLLVCPYHGWSYDDRGALSAIAQNKTFGDLDRDEYSMRAITCEERLGIVFVVLTPGVPMDLDEWLGDAQGPSASMRLDALHHFSTREIPGPNWKIAMDGYVEQYHFPYLHRTTIDEAVHGNASEFEALHRSSRVFIPRRGITKLKREPEEEWVAEQWVAHAFHLFPNTEITYAFLPSTSDALPAYGRHCLVHLILPGASVDRSITHQINLTTEPVTQPDDKAALEHVADESHRVVVEEDYWMGSQIQRTLSFAAPEFLLFGRNEPALTHYHRGLDQLLG